MKNRILFAFATALSLSASFVSFVSCKSNEIGVTNNNDYESYVTQNADPATDTTIDGPDRSQARIPAGALTETTAITLAKMKAGKYPDFPPGWVATGGVYSFEPHAQAFGKPVNIKVPYIEPGKGVRLVTTEPGGGWTPVDGAALAGGFATTQSPHFSFYTVVTGAPADPTLIDAGVDATAMDATIPDSAPDVRPDTAPPPPPTVFATAGGNVLRFFLVPAYDMGDAGPDAGLTDGGIFPLLNGRALAYGSSILFVAQSSAPDAGAITPFADPFGAMVQDGSVPLNVPGAMAVINGELWVANAMTNRLETYDVNGTMTWFGLAGTEITAMSYRPASNRLYVVQAMADQLVLFTVAGTGATKTVTPFGADAGTISLAGILFGPNGIVVTPWDELAISGSAGVRHFDLAGNDLGQYAAINIMASAGIGAVRWPGGLDEILVTDSELGVVNRYWFAPTDTTHMTPTRGASSPLGGLPTGMILAP